jgi:predicted nucleic-acid-binding protein
MVMVDANIILRILLNDNQEMVEEVLNFISNNNILIKNEVLAEVVFTSVKFYKMDKSEIYEFISILIEDERVNTESKDVILLALETFKNRSLDFVDCLLYAYNAILGYKVFTFDKKLKKLLK